MEERPIIVLLAILKDNLHQLENLDGLCRLIFRIYKANIINAYEFSTLSVYIRDHKPNPSWLFKYSPSYKSGYYFTPGNKSVRERYLLRLIREERENEERKIDYDIIFGVDNENKP